MSFKTKRFIDTQIIQIKNLVRYMAYNSIRKRKKKLEENCNKYFIKIILKIWLPSFFLLHPSCALLDIYFWVTLFLKIELLTFCITRSWIFYTPVLLLIKITFL